RDDPRERGLAGAGRPEEDDGGHAVGLDGAAEELARPEDMRLSYELVERAGPHPVGERGVGGAALLGAGLEEVGHELPDEVLVFRVPADERADERAQRPDTEA